MAGHQGSSTRGQLVEAISAVVDAERADTLTMVRGRVVSYDPATQKAVVKPLLKRKVGDAVLDAPDLQEVPVRQPRGGGYATHAPIKAGDEVDLHFASRSLDPYQTDGEAIDAAPGRMHHLSDAVAYPAGSSDKTKMTGLPTDRLHVGTDDGRGGLQVKPDGTLDLKSGDESLLDIWKEMLDLFKQHTHMGVPVDAPFVAAADALKARITSIQAD
jgi:hypothetical protein